MKLNEKQKGLIKDRLTPKLKEKVCPICEKARWFISEEIFEMREFEHGKMIIGKGSAVIPVISITCEECGYILLFNALTLGLINTKNG